MRKIIGTFLGFAALMAGLIGPIIFLGGLSGMIWGGKAFEGHLPKDSPQFWFGLYLLPPAMFLGAVVALCMGMLPILAAFDVNVLAKRERTNALISMARMMKRMAGRYSALMDKIISQEIPR